MLPPKIDIYILFFPFFYFCSISVLKITLSCINLTETLHNFTNWTKGLLAVVTVSDLFLILINPVRVSNALKHIFRVILHT